MLSRETRFKMTALLLERHYAKPNIYRDGLETLFTVFKGLYYALGCLIRPLVKHTRTIPLSWVVGGALIALISGILF